MANSRLKIKAVLEGDRDKLAGREDNGTRCRHITDRDTGRQTTDNARSTDAAGNYAQDKASGGANEGIAANGTGVDLIGVFLVVEEAGNSPNLVGAPIEEHLGGDDLTATLTGLKFAMDDGAGRNRDCTPISEDVF